MLDTFLRLTPVLAGFAVGFLLRQRGLTERRDGEFLFKLVFYICSPALAFASLSTVELTHTMLVLPLVSVAIAVSGFLAGRYVAKHLHLSPTQLPLFVIACMIVNTGFAFPFVQAIYGNPGVAALVTFDVANGILTFSWMYAIAARGNPDHQGEPVLLRKLFTSPPLYATTIGLLVNLAGWTPPSVISSIASTFGSPTGFLITLAIGTVFTPAAVHLRGSASALIVRLASAGIIGIGAVFLFQLEGTARGVILLLCVAPVGFNTVTFASLEKLDIDFASSTLSLSLIISLILSTALAIAIS